MKIVAYRPDSEEPAYIVSLGPGKTDTEQGHIVIPSTGLVGPEMIIASFLARGYWEDVPKDLAPETRGMVLRMVERKTGLPV